MMVKANFLSNFVLLVIHILIASRELLRDRSGHTELSVQLIKLANLIPAVVICEMLDSETGGALSVDKSL